MGLARIGGMADEEDRDRLTDSGQVMGTCDYMAPEQALDAHHADRRADVYSLGCTLYRLLTGQVPYRRDSLAQIILAHQQASVPSLCHARPDVPQPLDAVFHKMVAKQPEDRYQSMAEVIVALETIVGRGEYIDMPTETMPVGPLGNVPVAGDAAGGGVATAAKPRVEAAVAAGDTPTQQAAVETSRQLGPATNLLVRRRSPGGVRDVERRDSVLRVAVGEGRREVPLAERGSVGICLPGGDRDDVVFGLQSGGAQGACVVRFQLGEEVASGGSEVAERVGPVRHARQRLGVVPGLVG
jgi:hypothetical protein